MWCAKGPGTCFHVTSPLGLSQLLSLLGQVALMALRGDTASLLAALGPPAAGTAPSLHGHERGATAQGGRGAGPAQECSGAEVRPGGCDAAKPEGNKQEEQDSPGEPAPRAWCGESELWPRCCWTSATLTPHFQPCVELLAHPDLLAASRTRLHKETPQLKTEQCGVCNASTTLSVKTVMGGAR